MKEYKHGQTIVLAEGDENDTCAVATYHKITPKKDFSDTLQLRKRDGKWYAHVLPKIAEEPVQKADTTKEGKEIKSFREPVKKGN